MTPANNRLKLAARGWSVVAWRWFRAPQGAFGLIGGEKSIVGGQTGSVSDTAEMLAFTARHGIKPIIETFAMAEADRALEHTRSGKARLRAVLVA